MAYQLWNYFVLPEFKLDCKQLEVPALWESSTLNKWIVIKECDMNGDTAWDIVYEKTQPYLTLDGENGDSSLTPKSPIGIPVTITVHKWQTWRINVNKTQLKNHARQSKATWITSSFLWW